MNTIQETIENASNELSRKFGKAVSDWLGGCVKKFCPEAYEHFEQGDHGICSKMLKAKGYHFGMGMDGDVTKVLFMCEDVVLACAKIEIEIGKK